MKFQLGSRCRSLVGALALMCGCLWVAPVCGADSPTIAIVNNQRISENEFEFLCLSRRVKKDMQAAVRERFVEDLIDRALLKQFLDKGKVDYSREMLDAQVVRVETVIKDDGKNVNEVLRSLGYNRETLRAELALPLRWRSYAMTIITDSAIKSYWEMHRSKFDGTEVRAAQIVKALPAMPSASEVDQAKTLLSSVRQKVMAKELSFAEAAKQHSESPSGKDGGDLGTFGFRGRMPLEITQAAFKLKAGEISEPFQTPFGMHLLTVTEITPGDLSLEDARPEIFETLSQETQRRLVKELRSTAKITIERGNK